MSHNQIPFLQINSVASTFSDYRAPQEVDGAPVSPIDGGYPTSPVGYPNSPAIQVCTSIPSDFKTHPLSAGVAFDALQLNSIHDDLFMAYQNNSMLGFPPNPNGASDTYSIDGASGPSSPYQTTSFSTSDIDNQQFFTPPVNPLLRSPGSDIGQNNNFLFVDTFQLRRRSTSDLTNICTTLPGLQLPFINTAPISRSGSFDGGRPFDGMASAGGLLSPATNYDPLFFTANTPTSPLPTSGHPLNLMGQTALENINFNFNLDFQNNESNLTRGLAEYGGMVGGLTIPGDKLGVPGGAVRRKSNARSRSVSPNTQANETQHPCPVPGCGKSFNRRGNMVCCQTTLNQRRWHISKHMIRIEQGISNALFVQRVFADRMILRDIVVCTLVLKCINVRFVVRRLLEGMLVLVELIFRDAIRRHAELSGCLDKQPGLFEEKGKKERGA